MKETHTHHKQPRSLGGTDHPDNLAELLPIDHAIAHQVRWRMHGDWQDYLAWIALSGQANGYEIQQKKRYLANKDRVFSDETKEKLRKAARAQWDRPGAREAQSKKMKECNNSRGSNHQKTNKAVTIDGVEYISISEAARKLNTTRNTIKRKLR